MSDSKNIEGEIAEFERLRRREELSDSDDDRRKRRYDQACSMDLGAPLPDMVSRAFCKEGDLGGAQRVIEVDGKPFAVVQRLGDGSERALLIPPPRLVFSTLISGRDNVSRTGPIRGVPDSLHVRIYDDDEVIITTTGKIAPSSPAEYQRPYLVEKLSKLSAEPSRTVIDHGEADRALLCEVQIRGVDPTTKAFRNRIKVIVYDNGDVCHSATSDPVDADVMQKIINVLQRSYGPRTVTRKPRVGDWVEVQCPPGDYVEVLGRQEELNSGFFYVFVIVDDARDDVFGGRDSSGGVWRRSTDGDGWRWPVGMPRLGDEVEVRLGNSDWTRRKVEEFRLRRASITPGCVELGVYDGITLLWFSVSDRGKSWRGPVTS